MYKMIATMKRKPGLSMEGFQDYYETTHRKLAHHVAGFMADYRRTYPVANPAAPEQVYNPSGKALIGPENAPFDCVTEIWFEDEAALRGLFEIMARPEVGELFARDEERFVDRSTTRIVICEECRGFAF